MFFQDKKLCDEANEAIFQICCKNPDFRQVIPNFWALLTLAHNDFCYSAVAHILIPSVNLAFRPKSGFKNKCRSRVGFGLVTSDRVRAWKWGPFTTLCGCVGRGQKAEIERIHPPPTNSKNRLKSFCEVGLEILVGVGLHAWCPVALKICRFFKKRKSERKIFIVFVTLSDLNKTSNRAVTKGAARGGGWGAQAPP